MIFNPALKPKGRKALPMSRLWATTAFALLLASCAQMAPQAPALKAMDPSALHLSNAQSPKISETWWEGFQNPDLSKLIEASIQNNPSIALANTRIEKAQALAGITRATSQVQMNAGVDLDRQRFTQTGIYPPPLGGSMQTLSTLQLSGAWIPDVFGKYQAAYQSALGQVQASALEAIYVKTQLSSQIALQFVGLAYSVDERDLLLQRKKHVASLQHLLSERVKAGLDASLDLKSLEIENNDLMNQLSQVNNQIDLYRNALAALSAQSTAALSSLTPHLRQLQGIKMETQIGIDLLGRRADVAAAKARVLASLQSVEAAQLDFYPNLSLGFFAGYNSLTINQLTRNSSAQYGVLPSLNLPIFDGGRLNAQLGAKSAERDQAISMYNNTLLDAVKEASDALSTLQSTSTQLSSAQDSMKLASERLDIQTLKAKAGLSNQVSVLREALAQLQQERLYAQLHAKQLSSEVGLLKALGAGGPDAVERPHQLAQQP